LFSDNSFGQITSCRLVWPEDGTQNAVFYIAIWTAFQFTFGLLLPAAVISMAYIQLFRRLRRLAKSRRSLSVNKSHRQVNRMTRTVIVAVTTFIACQLPYHVMQTVALERIKFESTYNKPAFTSQTAINTFVWSSAISQILVYVSSCCNPVIYGITNENFRKYYEFL
jgi:di/tricarboxylate transporter